MRFNTTLVKVLLLEEKQVLLKAYCFNTTLVKVLYHVNTTVTRTWDVSIQLLLRFYLQLLVLLSNFFRFNTTLVKVLSLHLTSLRTDDAGFNTTLVKVLSFRFGLHGH